MGQSFLTSLGKGLIRSAVNQVGRDGGRVISNNIYGDAHSIPHRNVNSSYYNNMYDNIYTQNKILNESQVYIDKPNFGHYVLWFLLIIFTYGLGCIPLFIRGLYVYNKKTISCYKYQDIEQNNVINVPDRRYSEGYRTEINTKIFSKKICFELPFEYATQQQINEQKTWSAIYTIIGGLPLLFIILLCMFSFIKTF